MGKDAVTIWVRIKTKCISCFCVLPLPSIPSWSRVKFCLVQKINMKFNRFFFHTISLIFKFGRNKMMFFPPKMQNKTKPQRKKNPIHCLLNRRKSSMISHVIVGLEYFVTRISMPFCVSNHIPWVLWSLARKSKRDRDLSQTGFFLLLFVLLLKKGTCQDL